VVELVLEGSQRSVAAPSAGKAAPLPAFAVAPR